jgi:hypothetical protein
MSKRKTNETEIDFNFAEQMPAAKAVRTKAPRKKRSVTKCTSVIAEMKKTLKESLKQAILAVKQGKVDIKCYKKDIKKLGRSRKVGKKTKK